ncbi:MAG: ZIP family metal transporter [Bacteriovoracia bacterium]
MDLPTLFGLFIVTGGGTILGSLPIIFHRYLKESYWNWLESFGGGVMTGASLFSLLLPAYVMVRDLDQSYLQLVLAIVLGVIFIFLSALVIQKLTRNTLHQRAFLFVFVMALHNVPEGLAVGVDVAGLGWKESLPLTIAIFIQNLPEGFVSAMIFLLGGFSLRKAFLANGVTAVIESVSSYFGFIFVFNSRVSLPFMLAFSASCMLSVVLREVMVKARGVEPASFSLSGFSVGVLLCAVLDLAL